MLFVNCSTLITASLTEIEVSLGDPVTLQCDAKFYPGVLHFIEWYKGKVTVYSKFNGHEPFIHLAFQVSIFQSIDSLHVIRKIAVYYHSSIGQ